jgi:hypothetical protein
MKSWSSWGYVFLLLPTYIYILYSYVQTNTVLFQTQLLTKPIVTYTSYISKKIMESRNSCAHFAIHVGFEVLTAVVMKGSVFWDMGRAITQAFSRRLPTASVRVPSQLCEICDDQSETGEGFLRVLRFALPVLIRSNAPYSVYYPGRVQ